MPKNKIKKFDGRKYKPINWFANIISKENFKKLYGHLLWKKNEKRFSNEKNPLLEKEKWYYGAQKYKPNKLHPYTTIRIVFKVIAMDGSNVIVYKQEPGSAIKTYYTTKDAYYIEEIKLTDLSNIKGPFDTYDDVIDAIYTEVYG